ncbi:MAG: hypothetical protein RR580_07560, partial [Christensenellaceae bacterium]
MLEDAKDEAAANGVDTGEIVADSDSLYMNSQKDNENDYVTVVLKMWKEQGTVRIVKTTEKTIIKEETDTGYQLYP